jgi:Outer membrane lipoprotein-sorting protein
MSIIQTVPVYITMTFPRCLVMLSRSRMFSRHPWARRANRAFRAIQASVILVVLFSLVHPSGVSAAGAAAANPDLETVLTGSRQRIQNLDYRVTGRITQVAADGKRTNYKFVGKAHWFPDGLRLLSVFSGPGSDKTSVLLHMTVNGHLTIEAILPGEKTASAVPFEHWSDPLLGTNFSYEDMVENQFFWKDQELLPAEKYGARDCFVLKSTAAAQDRTTYASVKSWIDRSILFPVHVVKTPRATGQQKDFVYFGLRQIDGAWSASQVEAKVQGKPGSSIMVIEGGTGKAKLALKDFDLSQAGAQGKQSK